ncbi:Protein bli-3 [Grifola frondosa]|uniref:Protein bli-3 n=1 Tax=Grifola frondosa TaxID=5627 RepID=A0A1C7M0V8_GRIFR|nr:Protein bli-3 [Grifola frondosa]
MSNKELDPYTAKAQNDNLTPQEKVDGLHAIVNSVKTGMLTTRSSDGSMHSRAMAPAGPFSPTQITLVFLANRVSAKFDEIKNDDHVNVSFYDQSTTSWASYSGVARITQDKDKIAKHWNSMIAAWFGDLGDGVHKGDQNDPRVAVIEVIPAEVRAVSGNTAAPGELRTITKDEIQLLQGIKSK